MSTTGALDILDAVSLENSAVKFLDLQVKISFKLEGNHQIPYLYSFVSHKNDIVH